MGDDATTCQICFEQLSASWLMLGEQFCGPQCAARVCRTCMQGHIGAALDACFAGVLPRVRCPICLARLPMSRWSAFAEAEEPALARRYADFCYRACSLQAPCCHKVGYSHLPAFDAASKLPALDSDQPLLPAAEEPSESEKQTEPTVASPADAANASVTREVEVVVDTAEEELERAFLARCREFCFHRAESRAVVQFALDSFQDPNRAERVVEAALSRIADDERRAMLLLSFLYRRPGATTRCCKRAFCFNCKRAGHHSVCDGGQIDAQSCVARCRNCCVMIVKVEGCDSVSCVCGFTMSWGSELAIQDRNRRQLIAVDIFDRVVYERWEAWRTKVRHWAPLFQKQLEVRRKRILLRSYLPMLRRRLGGYVWRFRARRNREQLQREVFWEVYARAHATEMAAEVDECVSELMAITVALGGIGAPAVAAVEAATVA